VKHDSPWAEIIFESWKMIAQIGVGVGKFLGVWRNFSRILPTCSKKAFHVNSGAFIFKSKHVGRHFCSDFQGFLKGSERFCPDFRGFCPDL